jgi:hypothetical protein
MVNRLGVRKNHLVQKDIRKPADGASALRSSVSAMVSLITVALDDWCSHAAFQRQGDGRPHPAGADARLRVRHDLGHARALWPVRVEPREAVLVLVSVNGD